MCSLFMAFVCGVKVILPGKHSGRHLHRRKQERRRPKVNSQATISLTLSKYLFCQIPHKLSLIQVSRSVTCPWWYSTKSSAHPYEFPAWEWVGALCLILHSLDLWPTCACTCVNYAYFVYTQLIFCRSHGGSLCHQNIQSWPAVYTPLHQLSG